MTKNTSKIFGKVKFIEASVGYKLMTNKFVVNALTHCTTLLSNNWGKENVYEFMLDYLQILYLMKIAFSDFPNLREMYGRCLYR